MDISHIIYQSSPDLIIFEYSIRLNNKQYNLYDPLFQEHQQQLEQILNQNDEQTKFVFIMNRISQASMELVKYYYSQTNLKALPKLEIIDNNQKIISNLIQKATDESIKQAYQQIQNFKSEFQRIIFLHQLIMVDTYSSIQDKINNLQSCIQIMKQYKCNNQDQIQKYVKNKLNNMLHDKYRLYTMIMRKDLCQQTLMEIQQIQDIDESLQNILNMCQYDLLQSDYIYQIQQKTQINLNNITKLLQKLMILDIYDQQMKLIQIPIIKQDNQVIFNVDLFLTKLLQIIFGSLQIQELTIFGDLLINYQNYFQLIQNKQIKYVYHLCLSNCLQKDQALNEALKAFELAVEINDQHDIIEIVLNCQLLFIELDHCQEGIKFTQQFINNYGKQYLQLQFKEQMEAIENNLTYMNLALA